MSYTLGFLLAIGWVVSLFAAAATGAWIISEDAEKRLTRQLPVDEFWRKRGMR